MEKKRGNFTGNIGFILAAAGSAVGLGNIWKFPTLAGNNGGGYFLIFYLFFVVILGVPLILAESAIGRHAQKDPKGSYEQIAKESGCKPGSAKLWGYLGLSGSIANFIILCYYSVIAGWILMYFIKTFTTPVTSFDMAEFGATIGTVVWPIVAAGFIIIVTVFIVSHGIEGGIERVGKVLMPALIIMLIICAICACSRPGAMEGVKFMVVPDKGRMLAAGGLGTVALAALGQCFFSLSLGTSQFVAYGSYLKKDSDLVGNACSVPVLDTFVALLAGFATLTAVYAAAGTTGIEAQTGPGMLMYALPQSLIAVFGNTIGTVLTAFMFLLVLFAAFTSTIAMMEVAASFLVDTLKWERVKSCYAVGIAAFCVAVVCSLSNGILSGFTIGGMVFQDQLDWLISNLVMPLASICLCIFVGYVWRLENAKKEITNNGTRSFAWSGLFGILIRFVLPVIIAVVFLSGIGVINI